MNILKLYACLKVYIMNENKENYVKKLSFIIDDILANNIEKKCEICGKKERKNKCRICGREVCNDCYNKEKGMCIVCSETLCEICKRRNAVERCQICGKLVCPDCMVRIDKSRVVCRDCYEKLGLDGVRRIIEDKAISENLKMKKFFQEFCEK